MLPSPAPRGRREPLAQPSCLAVRFHPCRSLAAPLHGAAAKLREIRGGGLGAAGCRCGALREERVREMRVRTRLRRSSRQAVCWGAKAV